MDPDATIERLSAIDMRELAALADGSLPPRRRAAVQARVDASPELQALLAEQRRSLAAVHGAAGPAPAPLRARVNAQRRVAAPKVRRRRAGLVAGAAAALAAVIAALVLVLPGGSPGGPSIVQAAGLSVQAATAPSPPHYDDVPLLDIEVDDLRFPDWAEAFGWQATGSRVDQIGGRRAVTVFYRWKDRRVAYTILSGPELDVPHAFQPTVRNGVLIRHLLIGGRTIVTWERAGHTCVLTGQRVGLERMRRLAAWRSHGEIRY